MAGRALVTAPTIEPVTVAEAKLFARIDVTADDALVNDLITAARKWCEQWRGRAMLTQTWNLFLDTFPHLDMGLFRDPAFTPIGAQYRGGYASSYAWQQPPILVPISPVASVTSVIYTPFGGSPTTLDPTTYVVDLSNVYAPRLVPQFGQMWPTDLLVSANGVQVQFVAGYGANPSDVPEQLRLAVKQLVAFWYLNRDAAGTVPDAIQQMLLQEGIGAAFAYA